MNVGSYSTPEKASIAYKHAKAVVIASAVGKLERLSDIKKSLIKIAVELNSIETNFEYQIAA